MWNISDGKYSNAYYGANFVNQIGHGKPNLVMVKPVNGKHYTTFIYEQYFSVVNEGKEEAEETKQRDIENITFNDITGEFDGLRDGMVFSTDGLKWNTYHSSNPNLPVLESGSSIYIKYPESDTHFETVYRKFTKA
jgi:hypothetical protein